MFKNIVVTALRVAFKQKLITLLNILGIALGIAVSIVLIVHIRFETSFDKHIPDVERIYRVINSSHGENAREWATTSTPIFEEITDFFPEIEHAVRMRPIGNRAFSYENELGSGLRRQVAFMRIRPYLMFLGLRCWPEILLIFMKTCFHWW